ncbi:MAG: dynamin family protein [Thermomicrobiales bacterium]
MVREIVRKRIDAMRGETPLPLTATQEELIREEIDLLKRLVAAIERFPITAEDRAEIAEAADRLTSLFLLVIVGEFNAGKSAFINALVGAPVMPEGDPTTAVINLLGTGTPRKKRPCRMGSSSGTSRRASWPISPWSTRRARTPSSGNTNN